MSRSRRAELPAEIEKAARSFPILEHLSFRLKQEGVLEGTRVGWHCHLTWLTALAADALIDAGAQVSFSECDRQTSEPDAVRYMERRGARVYLGSAGPSQVLAENPCLLSDTGLVLISLYLATPGQKAKGACEITTSGIQRLRALENLTLPVVNVNDGQLKARIENFHGVGDGLIDALLRLTGKQWSGRPVAVVGYGCVGAGVAHYLKMHGASVTVVESDPIRCLVAHFDGFALANLQTALSGCELIVTATGRHGILGEKQWRLAGDGLLVVNVGHWPEEVEPETLRALSLSSRKISPHLEEFVLEGTGGQGRKRVLLAAAGSPANVVLLSGSAEPTLIHLTTEILSLSFIARADRDGIVLSPGELPVPPVVERQASEIALQSLGLQDDINQPANLESQDRTC